MNDPISRAAVLKVLEEHRKTYLMVTGDLLREGYTTAACGVELQAKAVDVVMSAIRSIPSSTEGEPVGLEECVFCAGGKAFVYRCHKCAMCAASYVGEDDASANLRGKRAAQGD